jgi:anaerobic ribonucleoside-triphosphate reductase activating protein
MGGDANVNDINNLAEKLVKSCKYDNLKIGGYSGRDEISKDFDILNFDYIKIGHYEEKLGGLNKKTTNQRLYKIEYSKESLIDITSKFWKKV